MFNQCSSLSNLKGLINWNVSKGTDFSCMFYKCPSLKDINGLINWNVSNVNNFSSMFNGCSSLKDWMLIIKRFKWIKILEIFKSQ